MSQIQHHLFLGYKLAIIYTVSIIRPSYHLLFIPYFLPLQLQTLSKKQWKRRKQIEL